ncbi:MAG: [FeFe] hydrogenase H-cluster radical SAM maturase HydE, partial [Candidatus Omnitrophota bacterium]
DKDYRVDGLKCGANVLMPNFTPQPFRKLYEIYPQKRCINEPVGACNFCMDDMAQNLGRFIDYSKADSLKQGRVNSNV